MTKPQGFTVEALASNGGTDLHISHAPDVDLDGTFAAWCHDTGELIHVNGWQMTDYDLIGAEETV